MAAWYIRPSGDNRELRELVLMSLYPSSSLFLCCPCTYVDFPLYFSLKKKKTKSLCSSENSHTPLLEEAVTQMTPEEHYRRMMSALNEHGTFEEQQQQRLYQLANSMAVPSHGGRALLPRGMSLGDVPEPCVRWGVGGLQCWLFVGPWMHVVWCPC